MEIHGAAYEVVSFQKVKIIIWFTCWECISDAVLWYGKRFDRKVLRLRQLNDTKSSQDYVIFHVFLNSELLSVLSAFFCFSSIFLHERNQSFQMNISIFFFQFNSRTPYVTSFFIGYSRWEAGLGVLLKTRSFTLEIHLSSTLFECCLNILFPMQLLGFSVIGSVIQADCIKAISAKWNMCPVSAAHSLFIRLLTSETNLKKNKAVYGPMGWRSTRWCHPGDVLHVDLFWMLLTFPSPERLHSPPSERER